LRNHSYTTPREAALASERRVRSTALGTSIVTGLAATLVFGLTVMVKPSPLKPADGMIWFYSLVAVSLLALVVMFSAHRQLGRI